MATDQDLDQIKQALENISTVDFKVDKDAEATGIVAQEVDESLTTIDLTSLTSRWSQNSNYGCTSSYQSSKPSIVLSTNGTSNSVLGSNWGTSVWNSNSPSGNFTVTGSSNTKNSLDVFGDANFEGDVKWKGRSLGDMLETIENRLSILVPDPEKLEHFEALKKAYEHYKTLEALCTVPKKEDVEK